MFKMRVKDFSFLLCTFKSNFTNFTVSNILCRIWAVRMNIMFLVLTDLDQISLYLSYVEISSFSHHSQGTYDDGYCFSLQIPAISISNAYNCSVLTGTIISEEVLLFCLQSFNIWFCLFASVSFNGEVPKERDVVLFKHDNGMCSRQFLSHDRSMPLQNTQ